MTHSGGSFAVAALGLCVSLTLLGCSHQPSLHDEDSTRAAAATPAPSKGGLDAPRLPRDAIVRPMIIELAMTPERFAGRWVQTVGILSLKYEDQALYGSHEAYEYLLGERVWLDLSDAELEQHRKLDSNWVILEGVFVPGPSGHSQMFRGRITRINRLERWYNREEYAQFDGQFHSRPAPTLKKQ